jgi:hypothetical protein
LTILHGWLLIYTCSVVVVVVKKLKIIFGAAPLKQRFFIKKRSLMTLQVSPKTISTTLNPNLHSELSQTKQKVLYKFSQKEDQFIPWAQLRLAGG